MILFPICTSRGASTSILVDIDTSLLPKLRHVERDALRIPMYTAFFKSAGGLRRGLRVVGNAAAAGHECTVFDLCGCCERYMYAVDSLRGRRANHLHILRFLYADVYKSVDFLRFTREEGACSSDSYKETSWESGDAVTTMCEREALRYSVYHLMLYSIHRVALCKQDLPREMRRGLV